MNENIELLEYLYQNSNMGVKSMTKLLQELNGKDNKIKKLVEEQLKEYEKFYKETKELIKKYKAEPKDTSIIAQMMADLGIKKEVKSDNSDSAIAKMIIEGATMGVVEVQGKIKNYEKSAKKDIIDLAKKYENALNKQIEELKVFL